MGYERKCAERSRDLGTRVGGRQVWELARVLEQAGHKAGLMLCLPAIPLLPEPLPPSAFLPLEGLRQVVLVVFLPSPHSHPNLTQGAKEDLPARARLGTFCGSGAPLSCPPQQSVIPFKSQDLSPCEHASGRFCGGRGPCPPGTPGRRVPD